MVVIGITGAIGHGKSSLADALQLHAPSYQHWESSALISQVASDLRAQTLDHPQPDDIAAINEWIALLPPIVLRRLHVSCHPEDLVLDETFIKDNYPYVEKLFAYLTMVKHNPAMGRGTITPANKTQLRNILQWLGGYLVLKLGGIWYDEIVRQIKISKVEVATVGGVRYPSDAAALRTISGYIIKVIRPSSSHDDSGDPTESSRDLIAPDCIVHNDGTLNDLVNMSRLLLHDLKNGTLRTTYFAHQS